MWSYSGDPAASKLDAYRYAIGDTAVDDPLMTDEEINYVMTKYTNENRILYTLFDMLSVRFDIDSVNTKLGPQSEDASKRAELFKERVKYYRTLLSFGGTPTYFQGSDKVFTKELFKNA